MLGCRREVLTTVFSVIVTVTITVSPAFRRPSAQLHCAGECYVVDRGRRLVDDVDDRERNRLFASVTRNVCGHHGECVARLRLVIRIAGEDDGAGAAVDGEGGCVLRRV